jgi:hypothetical protein
MAKPEVMATQLVAAAAAGSPWAYTGMAKHINAMTRNIHIIVLRIGIAPSMNRRQWVVDVILVQTPSR